MSTRLRIHRASVDFSFDFPPNAPRARMLDARMRTHLADSLDYLAECLTTTALPQSLTLAAIARNSRQGEHQSPSGFGLYYDIAAALLQDELDRATVLIDELRAEPMLAPYSFDVLALDALPSNARDRYCRLMDTDPETPFIIISPSAEAADIHRQRFIAALERLKTLLPELAGEVDALVRQVILVVGDPSLSYDFAGGSCYMLWGALFINGAYHPDELSMMEAIAHESAHSLLFGFTIEEPLVLNDADQRYASPLRDDPRPMDGIYHATFVCARMHWAMSQLALSSDIDADLAAQAKARADIHARSFHSGLALVREHGVLSDTGRALMEGAERYMAEASV